MKVTLVRHGEVEERYHRCYNGHIDIGLSDKGREEARRIAAHLKANPFDAVYCSDLLRAKETLSPFYVNIEPCFTRALREKSWGRHEGKTFDAITSEEGLEYQGFEQWINTLDGEPYDAYIERVRSFFLERLPRAGHRNVLVVTHAGVIRVLMYLLKGLSLEEAFCVSVPYGAYVELDLMSRQFGEVRCVS